MSNMVHNTETTILTNAIEPFVSVVIVNYNAGKFLATCIASVLPQVDEIIVVDNASTDFSLDLCYKQFLGEKKLIIIRNNTNLGFAAACNTGAKAAKGDYLFFLNPDCSLDNGAVAELMRVMDADALIGMAGGLLVNADGSEQGGGRRAIPTPWRSFVRAFGLYHLTERWPRLFFDFHLHKQPLPEQAIGVEAISGACMLVRRKAMLEVGLWDEAYFLHCEDLDWCMRFRQKGWRVMFVPSARITHALGVCGSVCPAFVEWHKHKGMIRFYNKFFRHQYPGILMWLIMLGVWVRFTFVVSYHTVKRVWKNLEINCG